MTSGPSYERNLRRAYDAAGILLKCEQLPFVPHLYTHIDIIHPQTYEQWMMVTQGFITACHALYRIPGESSGADREVEYALQHHIIVYHSMKALLTWANVEPKKVRQLAADIQRLESPEVRSAGIISSVGGTLHHGVSVETPSEGA